MAVALMSPLADAELARYRAAMAAYRADPDPVRFDEIMQVAADVGRWLDTIESAPMALDSAATLNATRADDVLRLLAAALRPGDWRTSHDLASACRGAMAGRSLALDVITISSRAREYERLLTEIGEAAGCAEFAHIAEHIRAQGRAQKETM